MHSQAQLWTLDSRAGKLNASASWQGLLIPTLMQVKVQTQLPCGHIKTVTCAAAAKSQKQACAVEVDLIMPGCQHTLKVPCSQQEEVRL